MYIFSVLVNQGNVMRQDSVVKVLSAQLSMIYSVSNFMVFLTLMLQVLSSLSTSNQKILFTVPTGRVKFYKTHCVK